MARQPAGNPNAPEALMRRGVAAEDIRCTHCGGAWDGQAAISADPYCAECRSVVNSLLLAWGDAVLEIVATTARKSA